MPHQRELALIVTELPDAGIAILRCRHDRAIVRTELRVIDRSAMLENATRFAGESIPDADFLVVG